MASTRPSGATRVDMLPVGECANRFALFSFGYLFSVFW
jgi:hypothetical protein